MPAIPSDLATTKAALCDELARQARGLLDGETHLIANTANFSALVFNALPDVSWAGFYFPDERGDGLIVSPF